MRSFAKWVRQTCLACTLLAFLLLSCGLELPAGGLDILPFAFS